MLEPSFWPSRQAAKAHAPADRAWSVVDVLARPTRRMPGIAELLSRTRFETRPGDEDTERRRRAMREDQIVALALAGWSAQRIAVEVGMSRHGVDLSIVRLRHQGRLPPLNGHQVPSGELAATNGHPV
jgi:hypothetical protein